MKMSAKTGNTLTATSDIETFRKQAAPRNPVVAGQPAARPSAPAGGTGATNMKKARGLPPLPHPGRAGWCFAQCQYIRGQSDAKHDDPVRLRFYRLPVTTA